MNKRHLTPDSMRVLPVKCGISDETAKLKASRLMNELMQYNDAENWLKGVSFLGFHEHASYTKRWRAILRLPIARKDLIGFWFDRKKQKMERPDPKRTNTVLLVKLYADELIRKTAFGQEYNEGQGLYLGSTVLERSAILHPERSQSEQSIQDSTIIFMKITFHSLQRLLQRGYGLSDDGEVSYERLLTCLYEVWLEGELLFRKTSGEAQVIVPYAGLRFVLAKKSGANNDAPLDLITVLPPRN
ncbi:hypothetical protein FWJ25_13350 [Marinobacter salinexigens]|uniref:Uncharacterized protein n=1 Tax=Marinobacter salinexigens TaxID=2919747 RepID=A0A5B0VEH2_9GAMM|nr:hypothetical protein [Marinobacter salinexigens]KAA1172794.1 hypothetical protein FWJ25_13350 [Marinobacter salinexigens]